MFYIWNDVILKFDQNFGEMEGDSLLFSKNYTKLQKKIIRNFH